MCHYECACHCMCVCVYMSILCDRVTQLRLRYIWSMEYDNTSITKICVFLFVLFFVLHCFSRLHLWHMEVPRLGVKLEPQVPAYAIATTT